jgi:DNA-directed RNA polymerase specialized sigma24 family protein
MKLHDSGELSKACRSIGGSALCDDLLQEVLLCLFEKPEAKILEAHEKGYFRFYVVRIVMNFASSKNSQFHKKYRNRDEVIPIDHLGQVGDGLPLETYCEMQGVDVIPDSYDYEKDAATQSTIDKLKVAYERLNQSAEFPYEQKLLDLHLSLRNKKAVSRLTGIPYRTVCHNLDTIYKSLKDAALNY